MTVFPFWDPPQSVVFNHHDSNDQTDETIINLANTEHSVGDAVYHPSYNSSGVEFDVAILFLPQPMNEIMSISIILNPIFLLHRAIWWKL